jgi:hypothetical protein
VGQDKQEYVQLNTLSSDHVNRVGQHSLNHAADGFDHRAMVMLPIRDIQRDCSCGMLLSNRGERDVCCFDPYILYFIVMIGFICLHITAIWPIKLEGFACTPITDRTRSQDTLDRLTIFGPHKMTVAPIKIAFLAGDLTAIGLVLVSLGPWNAIIITGRNGNAVNERD